MLSKSSDARTAGAPRRWLVLGFVLVALGVAGCGSSSSSGTTSSSSEPATTSSSSAPAATTSTSSEATKNGIPQGEHAGDGDGDNHGEASDGDGNI
jgi:hypothetical protein